MTTLVAVSVLVATVGSTPPAPQPEPDLTRGLSWLAGCWELRRGDRSTTEIWMAPAGGVMVGGSRTTINGVTREFEHLRLTSEADGLVYTAIPSGQQETRFTSIAVADSGFTVENKHHDFPQRIGYQRRGADSVMAWIEGPGPNGVRRIEFRYRRAACVSA